MSCEKILIDKISNSLYPPLITIVRTMWLKSNESVEEIVF